MPVDTIIDEVALIRMLATQLDAQLQVVESATTPRYMWDVGRGATETARVRIASVQRIGSPHTSNSEVHDSRWQAVLRVDVSTNVENIYGPAAACSAVVRIFEGHYMTLGTHRAQVHSTDVDIQTADTNDVPAVTSTVTLNGKLWRTSLATGQDVLT